MNLGLGEKLQALIEIHHSRITEDLNDNGLDDSMILIVLDVIRKKVLERVYEKALYDKVNAENDQSENPEVADHEFYSEKQ